MPKITTTDIARGYEKHPSIADYLPWKDYSEKHHCFLLEDGVSCAMAFDVKPIACEARPKAMLEAMMRSIAESLKNTIPLEKEHPWILQAFARRVNNLDNTFEQIQQHVAQKDTPTLTQAHLDTMHKHLDYVTQPGGIFFDQLVTNTHFRGGTLKVTLCLYRKFSKAIDKNKSEAAIALARAERFEQMTRTANKMSDQLRAAGLCIDPIGAELYFDLVRWFNPKPTQTNGNLEQLICSIDLAVDSEKPFGWDLTEQCFFSAPESTESGWLFDGVHHKVITVQSLTKNPEIGHITGERQRLVDDKIFTLLDHLPDYSIFSMHITFQALSSTELHLKSVFDSAIGHDPKPLKVRGEVEIAQQAIAHGDYLFPVAMALYIRADSETELKTVESQAEVLLNSNGFKVITDDEVFPANAYLCFLPMAYDVSFDQKNSYRSKYLMLSDIAKLLPFYGRSTGTNNPGTLFFTRSGEPWMYDLFLDRTKNAHLLLLGETGTGKSNLLNFLIIHMISFYNPRIIINEAGGSFDLLGEYCARFGLSVNKVKIDPKNPVSLNPFANGLKVLDQIEALDAFQQDQYLKTTGEKLSETLDNNFAHAKEKPPSNIDAEMDTDEEGSQDILGDMVLATLLMITGGERKEEERITRADRMLVMDAIIAAAKTVKASHRRQMIAEDIINAFEQLANTMEMARDPDKIKRAREMADGMRYFTKDPVSSRFFNTYGNPWPLADVTIVNMGIFANEGYEAQRSIAFAGCVSNILALAEANQASKRPIIALFDENHLFTKIPLLAAIQTRIAKMGRKLGLWLWVATQNLKDFADEAHKMLSLIETWICLALPPDEIDQIKRFKVLTPEQEALFLSARKSPGQYTEGILLSPKTQGLFRNVPPRLYLAMAMTEQEEKNQRKMLMQQYKISEIAAAEMMAKAMMKKTPEKPYAH